MTLIELARSRNPAAIEAGVWTAQELNARDENGRTPLMHAAAIGDYKSIAALKEAGADLDLRDNEGMRAVDHAAKNGHSNALIYLIEGGCGG